MCSVDSGDTPRKRKKHLDFQETVTIGDKSQIWFAFVAGGFGLASSHSFLMVGTVLMGVP